MIDPKASNEQEESWLTCTLIIRFSCPSPPLTRKVTPDSTPAYRTTPDWLIPHIIGTHV
jgi:hypothetical protein